MSTSSDDRSPSREQLLAIREAVARISRDRPSLPISTEDAGEQLRRFVRDGQDEPATREITEGPRDLSDWCGRAIRHLRRPAGNPKARFLEGYHAYTTARGHALTYARFLPGLADRFPDPNSFPGPNAYPEPIDGLERIRSFFDELAVAIASLPASAGVEKGADPRSSAAPKGRRAARRVSREILDLAETTIDASGEWRHAITSSGLDSAEACRAGERFREWLNQLALHLDQALRERRGWLETSGAELVSLLEVTSEASRTIRGLAHGIYAARVLRSSPPDHPARATLATAAAMAPRDWEDWRWLEPLTRAVDRLRGALAEAPRHIGQEGDADSASGGRSRARRKEDRDKAVRRGFGGWLSSIDEIPPARRVGPSTLKEAARAYFKDANPEGRPGKQLVNLIDARVLVCFEATRQKHFFDRKDFPTPSGPTSLPRP